MPQLREILAANLRELIAQVKLGNIVQMEIQSQMVNEKCEDYFSAPPGQLGLNPSILRDVQLRVQNAWDFAQTGNWQAATEALEGSDLLART